MRTIGVRQLKNQATQIVRAVRDEHAHEIGITSENGTRRMVGERRRCMDQLWIGHSPRRRPTMTAPAPSPRNGRALACNRLPQSSASGRTS